MRLQGQGGRFFDGAQSELGIVPIQSAVAVAFLIGAFWGIRVSVTDFLPAPTEVGTGTSSAGQYTTGVTVSRPGSLLPGDVVVLVIRTENSTDPAFVCSGFTEVYQGFDASNNTTNITVMIGTGFTGTGTFSITSPSLSSTDWVGRTCTAWRGARPEVIVGSAYAGSPGGAPFNIPSITTTSDNTVVLAVGGQIFTGNTVRTLTPSFNNEITNDATWQQSLTFATAGPTGAVSVDNSAYLSAVALLVGIQPG